MAQTTIYKRRLDTAETNKKSTLWDLSLSDVEEDVEGGLVVDKRFDDDLERQRASATWKDIINRETNEMEEIIKAFHSMSSVFRGIL